MKISPAFWEVFSPVFAKQDLIKLAARLLSPVAERFWGDRVMASVICQTSCRGLSGGEELNSEFPLLLWPTVTL